jgi:hypothetical protein
MVLIQPVTIWNNGIESTASILNLWCVNDNLSNQATFCYQMLTDNMNCLSQANLTMTGSDYANWQTNQYAYDWAANRLNLTIIGDYTTTTTTTTSSTTVAPTTSTTTSSTTQLLTSTTSTTTTIS